MRFLAAIVVIACTTTSAFAAHPASQSAAAHPTQASDATQTASFPIFRANEVILFQGDSITDGGRDRTGTHATHLMGQNYTYIIAAQAGARYPEQNLTFLNRGIAGNTVGDLTNRWQSDTLDLKPDLLSILIGINDTFLSARTDTTVEAYQQMYDKLLADTLAALPNVKIVLGEPFLLPVGKHKQNYAASLAEVKLRQQVVIRLAEKYHLPLVRYQEAFDAACRQAPPEYWSVDGVHPTPAGHGLMAREWLKTVAQFWPNG